LTDWSVFKVNMQEERKEMGLKKLFTGKMSRRKKIIIVVVIALIVLAGIRISGSIKDAALKQAAELNRTSYTPVEVLTVKKQNISSTIVLSGKVQADKEAPVMVKTPGKVTSVYAKPGDHVRKDQVLFSLDKTDVLTSYNQAVAGYQMAEAGYKTNLANYNKSKENLERMKQLFEIGAISQLELEQAEMAASDAALQTIEGQYAQAKAAYDAATKTMNDMDVKSPIEGILTSLDASVGSIVSNAAPVGKVVDLNKVYVTVSVGQNEINSIKNGQEVLVEVPSASVKVKGVIESLSVAANAQGKYSLKTFLDNKDGAVKPGMFANVTLSTAEKSNVLAVPTDTVVFHGGKNVVYIAQDNTAVEKEVTTGLENGTDTEIISGLSEGDIVIVKGQNFVKDGTEIKIVEQTGGGAQ